MLFWVVKLKIRVISVDVTQVSDGKIDNNKTLDTDNDARREGRVEGEGGGGGAEGGRVSDLTLEIKQLKFSCGSRL